MPTHTERRMYADALHRAFLINLIAEAEAASFEPSDDCDSDDSSSSSSASSSSSSGMSIDSDSSLSSSDDSSEDEPTLSETYVDQLAELYCKRYLRKRGKIPKSSELLHLLLHDYKLNRPEIFRSYLRITPECFDDLVAAISDDPVFHNNSNNIQMPVEHQLAIALYRFGHYGNAASILKVALQFGVGYGTVHLVTTRVIKATCSEAFRSASVQWASPEQKEVAKQWVEEASGCRSWRNGWIMVDGTLIPLFRRPGHYGNVWFDRKSNYSMNVQLISTPDLRIRDYGIGLPGSQHDATAWEETRLPQQHNLLLEENEFVWADTAYPLRTWCQSPYKKPDNLLPDNKTHNYHVSAVRIRSEHCVGFLKGRFSSLRGLRVAIDGERGVRYASLWIMACINIHAFAMDHEDGCNMSTDAFARSGQRYARKQRRFERRWRRYCRRRAGKEENGNNDDMELLEGKIKRETLKEELLNELGISMVE